MPNKGLDTYYNLFFRGNRLYNELAKLLGESVQTLFLMRLLLGEDEGLCQSEICESLSVPKQTMSRILKELEKSCYVEQTPSSRDGREKIFSLTEKGKKHASKVMARLNEIEEACIANASGSLDATNEFNQQYLEALEQCIDNERKGQ